MAEANLTEEVRLAEQGTSVPQEPGELEQQALLSIAKEFSQVEKVTSILSDV